MWLADDSALEAEHTLGVLAHTPCRVEAFPDGASLLERLADPDAVPPDLVLLDWVMPGVSGLEVCRYLRERYPPSQVAVLMLTSNTHEGALEEAFGAGANDYVAKPARPAELLARVRLHLQARRDAEALREWHQAQARVQREAEVARAEAELARAEAEAARAEAEAARAEAVEVRGRLTALFENAPALICTFRGPELVYEFTNPLYQRLVGVGRPLVGRPVRETVPEAVGQGVVARLEQVYRTGEPHLDRELALRLDRTGDGTLADAFVDVVYQPARDRAGRVVGVDVFGFEVTEQVLARQRTEALAAQLQQSEERLRRVVEATGTGTWQLDVAAETLEGDARFRELFSLAPGEPFPLSRGLSLIHPEDGPRVAQAVAEALAGRDGGAFREEYRASRLPDGRWRWLEARGQAFCDPDGTPTHILGTGVDVTARKEAEAARDDLLDAITGQPLVGVVLSRGPELRFERVNAAYRQLVGGREVQGLPLLEALPELVGQGFDTLLHGVQRSGAPLIQRERLARVDRGGRGVLEEGYFDLVYQPLRTPDGVHPDVLHLVLDVTDRVRARQESERHRALEQGRAEFEQQLIGIVSHDLRNPLSAIIMSAATLLRRSDLEERQRRPIGRILASAERANRMIHDLLDFTQARLGGGIPTSRAPVDLHALARQVVDEVNSAQPERAVEVRHEGDGSGAWDADRLAQVLGNLLSNALHYSPADTPVRVLTRGEADAVVLQVHNRGVHIPPELLARLFRPMQRGAEQGASAGRSVGLGLYIVDQVVRAHGGGVEVTSTAEGGTTFTVRLPRRASG